MQKSRYEGKASENLLGKLCVSFCNEKSGEAGTTLTRERVTLVATLPKVRQAYRRTNESKPPPFAKLPFARLPFARLPFARLPFARLPFARLPFARLPFARLPFARFAVGCTGEAKLTESNAATIAFLAAVRLPIRDFF